MDWIDEHKWVKEDQLQGKGKAKISPLKRRDPRPNRYGHNRPRRDFTNQPICPNAQVVSSVFKEQVYQILEKIKNDPYFRWPNKMASDPTKRNQGLNCQYHQDRGHTTEDCETLRDHWEQLVKAGKLKHFMHQPSGKGSQIELGYQREAVMRPPLRTIIAIFATLSQVGSHSSRVMSIATRSNLGDQILESKRVK